MPWSARPRWWRRASGALAEPAGGDLHFIARLYWPGMAADRQRDAMRLFAETVIPSVRNRAQSRRGSAGDPPSGEGAGRPEVLFRNAAPEPISPRMETRSAPAY